MDSPDPSASHGDCPVAGDSLVQAAIKVLREPDPQVKAEYTNEAGALWKAGKLSMDRPSTAVLPPDRPARDDAKVQLVAPWDVPRLGRGGTLQSRQAMLHSLVHIESWAVDLSWDMIARWGCSGSYHMPKQFFDDFVRVAEEECKHYWMLNARLEELGSFYGALPAHDSLWDSARETAGSLPARLAVEHCVHEARGLDVLPQTIRKFQAGGDETTAALLRDVIYQEEISHCAAGVKWLTYLYQQAQTSGASSDISRSASRAGPVHVAGDCDCLTISNQDTYHSEIYDTMEALCAHEQRMPLIFCTMHQRDRADPSNPAEDWKLEARQHASEEDWFHSLVRRHFRGPLKPPFNEEARAKAGFLPSWYLPLAQETHRQDASSCDNAKAVPL